MFNYLDNNKNVFKIFTVISFLLIYASGDKMGVFTFMMLIMYPFIIADGSTNLFALNLPSFLVVLIDFAYLAATYFFVYYILRSGIKKNNSTISKQLTICGIVIFYIYLIKVLLTSENTNFSIITIMLFVLISLITIVSILINRTSIKD